MILTTLTTVLGLAPLLFETSRQAQFLKPTVITLVYGLGFGLVLVLLVVPALLAIGHDVGRTVRASRRAARGRAPGLQIAMGAVWASVGVWFVATLGTAIVTGALPGFLGGSASLALAFGLFVAGVAGVTFLVWMVAATRFGLARKA